MKILSLSALAVLFFCFFFQSSHSQTPVPCEEPYPQVQDLSVAVSAEDQNIAFSWTPIIGSLGCRVQVRQEGTIPWLTRTIVEPDLDSTSISGAFLVYQSNYDARVACGCSANPLIIGDFSEIVSFNTGTAGQQVPCENPYPAVLNPTAAPDAEGNAFVLTWDPIPQSAGCQIEYSLLEGSTLNAAQVLESELSSFSIPEGDLIPNQDYQWRVRCGCSLSPLVVGPWIEFQEFNSGNAGIFECPDLMANIGDTCDSAINGVVTENCECLVSSPCGDLQPGTVCNPATGRIWMDRNLGASQVAVSPDDPESFGDYYQWGRATTDFTINTNFPFDWSDPQNDNYWQGVDGINNPCPNGFRIPTEEEWDEERLSWTSNNIEGGFNSPLRLPAAGYRYYLDAQLDFLGSFGEYWSSTISTFRTRTINLTSTDAFFDSNNRANGFCVRCIQD